MNAFHDTTNLRLEVETSPAGLPNLVKNPSGLKGAWGYITPVASTVMTSDGAQLTFKTTPSQAANFTTEFLPVAASKFVAARIDLISITASHNIKVTFDWYDTNKAFLSSSTTSGSISALGTTYVSTVTAPASTAYAKARFNFFNGASNPTAGALVTFNNLMVTWANTATAISTTTRTNLIPNPSFETNTSGWSQTTAGTIARSTAQALGGAASLALTAGVIPSTGGAVGGSVLAPRVPVTPGKDYTVSAWVRPAGGTPRRVRIESVNFWTTPAGSGAAGNAGAMAYYTETAGTWVRPRGTVTAPNNAVSMDFTIALEPGAGIAVGEVHYIDSVLVEQASSVGNYFDGASTAGGVTYAWSGTAQLSSSTETGSLYPFAEPITWRNILGPTHSIDIDRPQLDVGTMVANVIDATLDPAVSTDLAPGKTVRCTTLVGSTWESLFEGRIDNAHVAYTRVDTDAILTSITLTATDNITQLANQVEPRGVATIAALPYLLEGKGVPWNCNGSGNQVAAATQVSVQAQASVLDQAMLTRDSVSGYAWIDRFNVLNAYDSASIPAAVAAYFSGLDTPITNPDFEASAAGWNVTPSVFTNSGATVSRITSDRDTGIASGQVVTTAASNQQGIWTTVTVPAGVILVITARVKSVSGRPVLLRSRDTTNGVTGTSGITSGTGSWQTLKTVLTTGASPATIQVAVCTDTTAGASTFLVDSIDVPGIYSAIDASFNTDDVINQVLVTWLRYDAVNGTTTPIAYGPYSDAASIATYGPHQAEFTIQGAAESAPTIAAFANAVLAANKTPVRKAERLTMPVKDARSLAKAAKIDLFSLVNVTFAPVIAANYRVSSIKHSITTDAWLVDYGFRTDGAVVRP